MSLLSWLLPHPKPVKPVPGPDSSGLLRSEPTRPVGRNGSPKESPAARNGQPANRKGERMARRELLYGVVREAMVRAGVLSTGYKFKVLSLDARGRQFLVMVDLAQGHGGETNSLPEIEAMVAQTAKARYDIVVTAVYWRMNEHVAVGMPESRGSQRGSNSRPMPLLSQPAPLDSRPSPLISQPAPLAAVQQAPSRFEPIHEDEVAAFKRALAAGVANPAAVAAAQTMADGVQPGGTPRRGPQNYTLLTGYEDTELPDSETRAPALSGTQYGELR